MPSRSSTSVPLVTETPREIHPGLFHWTALHPAIRVEVSSYYLARERVAVDPLLPTHGGMKWFKVHGPPRDIVLTNRLHSRHSARLAQEFGCTVWCNRAGIDHLSPGLKARPFDGGDELPGGIEAIQIGVLCPDESALLIPSMRAVAVADGVIREGDGPLMMVPDEFLADDPKDAKRVKRELKAAYRRLAKKDFDHLLLAHGNPWLDTGPGALRAWAASRA